MTFFEQHLEKIHCTSKGIEKGQKPSDPVVIGPCDVCESIRGHGDNVVMG